MPRNVRNFWIEIEVDGRKERIACGPKSASGGFTMKLLMRNEGEVMHVANISGRRVGEELEAVISPVEATWDTFDNEFVTTTAR
jgi:hypothetical protein